MVLCTTISALSLPLSSSSPPPLPSRPQTSWSPMLSPPPLIWPPAPPCPNWQWFCKCGNNATTIQPRQRVSMVVWGWMWGWSRMQEGWHDREQSRRIGGCHDDWFQFFYNCLVTQMHLNSNSLSKSPIPLVNYDSFKKILVNRKHCKSDRNLDITNYDEPWTGEPREERTMKLRIFVSLRESTTHNAIDSSTLACPHEPPYHLQSHELHFNLLSQNLTSSSTDGPRW